MAKVALTPGVGVAVFVDTEGGVVAALDLDLPRQVVAGDVP